MLLQKRVDESLLGNHPFEYHWRCKHTKLTHLAFADDLLMFCGKSIPSVKVLSQALQDFSQMSGLSPNRHKSTIYISGASSSFNQEVQNILGFSLSSLPLNYLGVPILSSRLSYSDCIPLIGKITNRIQHWTARFLTYAGRLLLIKSVIISIQQYWSRLFILPKKVINKVEQIM